MARAQGLWCLTSQATGDEASRAKGAACICCIGPHHKPSGKCGSCLTTKLDLTIKTSGIGRTLCCGGPKTQRVSTANSLCRVRSSVPASQTTPRTPRAAKVCCVLTPPPESRTPRTPKTPRTRHACCVRAPPLRSAPRQGAQGKKAKLGRPRRWFRSVRHTIAQSPCRAAAAAVRDCGNAGGEVKIYNHTRLAQAEEATALKEEDISSNDEYALLCREGFSREDVAAVTIQAYFRGHLARRAFKALRSLVRLQAVTRGAYVRRQAEVAIHCMQALVRLQLRVRARQLLAKSKEAPLLQN